MGRVMCRASVKCFFFMLKTRIMEKEGYSFNYNGKAMAVAKSSRTRLQFCYLVGIIVRRAQLTVY